MQVKLASITKPEIKKENGEFLTSEEFIVYCARVSSPKNQLNTDTAPKLLNYCIKNKHWSIFDQVNLGIEVTTSKAIGIQILRHWSIKPQEFSQRYAEVTDIEPIQLRKAGSSNRQSSTEEFNDDFANELVKEHIENCKVVYQTLLKRGVAKECARMVLPMATSTTLYLNGSVRSWLTYFNTRLEKHTQLEHREVAMEIAKIFQKEFPNITKTLSNFNDYNGGFM